MLKRQKSKHSSGYKKFGDKDSGSDEETELFIRDKPPRREIPTVNKTVEEGDTLQSIAIRYHCTIEDLKRVNNIHKENEIFARTTIKVPYRPFSAALAAVHQSGSSSPEQGPSQIIDREILNDSLVNLSNNVKDNEVNDIIFNSNIIRKADLTPPLPDLSGSSRDEEVNLLPHEQVLVEPISTRLNCSGADGDISVFALVLCILIVILAVPLIYIFYIAEHLEQYHNHIS